jgi:hypothetical protein
VIRRRSSRARQATCQAPADSSGRANRGLVAGLSEHDRGNVRFRAFPRDAAEPGQTRAIAFGEGQEIAAERRNRHIDVLKHRYGGLSQANAADIVEALKPTASIYLAEADWPTNPNKSPWWLARAAATASEARKLYPPAR